MERRRVQKVFRNRSRTKTDMQEQANINTIIGQFRSNGIITHTAKYQGRYGDFLQVPKSLQEAKNQIRAAHEMFMTIPAEIREEFYNDPNRFLKAVQASESDPKMRRRLEDLGLLKTTAKPDAAASPPGAVGEPETPPQGAGA